MGQYFFCKLSLILLIGRIDGGRSCVKRTAPSHTVMSSSFRYFTPVAIFPTISFSALCFRNDLDADEYNETKQDTIEQLKEFQQKLSRFSEGNLSLVDHFGATQLVSLKATGTMFDSYIKLRRFFISFVAFHSHFIKTKTPS